MPFGAPMVVTRHHDTSLNISAGPVIPTHGLQALPPADPTCATIKAPTPIQQELVVAWLTESLPDPTTRMARITAVCRRVDNLLTPQPARTQVCHADISDCSALEMWLACPTEELLVQRLERVEGVCSAVDDVLKDGMYLISGVRHCRSDEGFCRFRVGGARLGVSRVLHSIENTSSFLVEHGTGD